MLFSRSVLALVKFQHRQRAHPAVARIRRRERKRVESPRFFELSCSYQGDTIFMIQVAAIEKVRLLIECRLILRNGVFPLPQKIEACCKPSVTAHPIWIDSQCFLKLSNRVRKLTVEHPQTAEVVARVGIVWIGL